MVPVRRTFVEMGRLSEIRAWASMREVWTTAESMFTATGSVLLVCTLHPLFQMGEASREFFLTELAVSILIKAFEHFFVDLCLSFF